MYKHLIFSTLSFRFLWVTQSTCCGAILQYSSAVQERTRQLCYKVLGRPQGIWFDSLLSNLVCIWKVGLQLSETRDCVPKEFLHGRGLLTLHTRVEAASWVWVVTLKLCFLLTLCWQSLTPCDHLDTLSPSKHCAPLTLPFYTQTPSQWPCGQALIIVCCGQLSHGIEIIKILTISCWTRARKLII